MEPGTLPDNLMVKIGKKIFRFIDQKILLAGTAGLPKEKLKRTRLVNSMCAITAFLALSIGFLFYVFTDLLYEIFIPAAIEATLFTSIIFLNVRRLYNLASISVLLVHLACAVYFALILGALINIPIILAYLFGLCLFIFNNKLQRWVAMTAIALSLVLIEANSYLGFVKPLDMPLSSQLLFRWIALPSFLFFDAMILNYYNIEIKRLYKQVEDFVLKIAHDLRNIIDANASRIRHLKEELHKDLPNIERMKGIVNDLSSANENMGVIVHNVLDSAESKIKWQVYNETFSLEYLIKNVTVTLSSNAIERDLTVVPFYDQEMPEYIVSDMGKMNTILNNFLSNAIKYSDEGTEIRIAVMKDKAHYTISVSNSCPPIPSHKLSHLFDERFTAKNDEKVVGSGLGLYFVKRTVEQFNGTYGVTSNDTKTTFYVRLGLMAGKKVDISEIIGGNNTFKGTKIFFAEDNAMSSTIMTKYLSTLGCVVSCFQNGLEVIAALDGNSEPPDCFIIDDQMPLMTGYELLKVLKDKECPYKDIPVIMMTGGVLSDTANKFMEAKAAQVIIKPIIKFAVVKAALSQHLQKRNPVNAG